MTPVVCSHLFLPVSRAPAFRALGIGRGRFQMIFCQGRCTEGTTGSRDLEAGEHCLESSAGIQLDYGV